MLQKKPCFLKTGLFINSLSEIKSIMDNANGFIGFIAVDKDGNFDFGRGYHFYVDISIGKSFEHFCCNAGMSFDSGANDGNFCDGVITGDISCFEEIRNFAQSFDSFVFLIGGNGEADKFRASGH